MQQDQMRPPGFALGEKQARRLSHMFFTYSLWAYSCNTSKFSIVDIAFVLPNHAHEWCAKSNIFEIQIKVIRLVTNEVREERILNRVRVKNDG